MTFHPRGSFLSFLFALAMASATLPGAAIPVLADEPVTIILQGDEKPEVIARTIEALAQGGKAVTVRIAPKKAEAAGKEGAGEAPPNQIEVFWDHFVSAFEKGNEDIPKVGALPADAGKAWDSNLNGREGMPALVRLLLVLGLSVLAGLAARLIARPWLASRFVPQGPLLVQRFRAAVMVGLYDLVALAAFWFTSRLLLGQLLPQADFASRIASNMLVGVSYAALYIIVGRFLLSPGHPERRLLHLPRADRHFKLLVIFALLGNVLLSVAATLGRVAGEPATVTGLFALLGLPPILFKLWWFWDMRHDMTALILGETPEGEKPHVLRAFLAHAAPWFYLSSSVLLWMIVRAATVMPNGFRWAVASSYTQVLLILIPVGAVGLTALIRSIRAARAEIVQPTPLRKAFGQTLESGVGALAWAGGLYLMAWIWSSLLVDVNSAEYGATIRQITVIATTAFIGWVLLKFLRSFFDAYAPSRAASAGPVEEDDVAHDDVPSRLGTVLPVLRGLVLGAVMALTGLIIIARLGVDIGPLLAGFGILGLAISFGSQALVRDIVSGFFFMVEDAFRVGEYVDTGRLKGTVEKISLRSVQLRHQSGQIHTVPFGQIPSLTNASRDWATIKYNLRLDRSVDIEQARKVIKKVGVAMMEDPELSPYLIAPLKMQGVADIADNAIVVRLKFTALPAHASVVQREAMKRVYRALNEAGIPFASNAVTVNSMEDRMAAAAALARQQTAAPSTPAAPAG